MRRSRPRVSLSVTDGETFCEGPATFMVASGQTTQLMVTLHCKGRPVLGAVRVDGTLFYARATGGLWSVRFILSGQ